MRSGDWLSASTWVTPAASAASSCSSLSTSTTTATPLQGGDARVRRGPVAFGGVGLEARPWVELVEDQCGDREPGDHEASFGDEASHGWGVRNRAEQPGRHVLTGAILGQRPTHLL